jgi:hypothetical protein
MSFQIHALPADLFEPLFSMSDGELAKVPASKMLVDSKPGYPCRVSLADAEVGETVVLVNYMHQSAETPYQATHAIIIRENAKQEFPDVGTVPAVLATRLISARAFDESHHMIDADVVDGSRLSEAIPAMLENPEVAYLHLHNARQGCFAARVTRA